MASRIVVVLLICALLLAGGSLLASGSAATDAGVVVGEGTSDEGSTTESSPIDAGGGDRPTPEDTPRTGPNDSVVKTVRLVTGDRIRIVDRGDNRTYHPADEGRLDVVDTGSTTYALPTDRDQRLDRSLFDVDALLAAIEKRSGTDEHGSDDGTATETVRPSSGPTGTMGVSDSGSIPVVVTTEAPPDAVAGAGIENPRRIAPADAVAVDLPTDALPESIDALFDRVDVDRIALDRRIDGAPTGASPAPGSDADGTFDPTLADDGTFDPALEPIPGTDADGAFDVDADTSPDRLSEANVTVAVVDTGIDPEHPDLEDAVVDRVDFVDDDRHGDPSGHGTGVAGILAGTGVADERGYEGVAPGVDLVDVRALNAAGSGQASNLLRGIEYAIEEADADVIVLSTGGPIDGGDDLARTIEWASDRGAVVVTSAGNAGEPRSIDATGRADAAITVGAYDHETGEVAAFSSKGPTLDGRVKPDVIARGTAVPAPGSSQADGRTYRRMGGTSAAAPQVAGVAARMLAAEPELEPNEIRSRIATTARPLDGPTVFEQGSGRVDFDRALDPDVLVDPATVSIGAGDDDRERVLTVENRDDQSHEIAFVPDLRVVDGGTDTPPSDAVALNRTELTVDPGETEHVAIRVDGLPAGTYSATLGYEVNGVPRSVAVGIVDGGDVTVEKRHLDGSRADEGDVLVFAADGSHEEVISLENGSASFFAAGGTYTLWSTRTDAEASTTVLLSERRSFDGPATVVLDERETMPVGPDPSGLESVHGELTTLSKAASMTGTAGDHDVTWDVSVDRTDAPTVRATPDPALSLAVSALLVPDAEHDSETPLDSPDVFQLAWGTEGVTGQRQYVTHLSLDTTLVEYNRQRVDERLAVEYWAQPRDVRHHRQYHTWSLGDRSEQLVHRLVPGPEYGIQIDGDSGTGTAVATVGSPSVMGPTDRTPRRTVSRFGHPFHAQLSLAAVDGERRGAPADGGDRAGTQPDRRIGGAPMVDGAGTAVQPPNGNATLVVDVDGTRSTHEVTDRRIDPDALPAIEPGENATIRLTATAPNATLSTRTVSELFVDGTESGDRTPPSIAAIDVANADETSAVTGEEFELAVSGPGFERVVSDRLWYAVGHAGVPPWEDPEGWHRVPTSRDGYDVTGTASLAGHDLPGIAPSDPLAVDDTPLDDRPDTISVAVAVETFGGHRERAMTADAVHIGAAPDDSTVHLGARIGNGSGPDDEGSGGSGSDDEGSGGSGPGDEAFGGSGSGDREPSTTANDTVAVLDEDGTIEAIEAIEADGSVAAELPRNGTYVLGYRAGAPTEGLQAQPADQRPAVYALDRVDATDDEWLGTYELPDAAPLSVSVVDERGEGVENATVRFRSDANGATMPITAAVTNETGRAVLDGGESDIAVAGSIELTVDPPADDPDRETTVERTLAIDEPTAVTVELPLVEPEASLSVSDRVVERGDLVDLSAADSEFATGNATYWWDVTGNGQVDRTTDDPELSLLPTTPGERQLSVTVVDEVGNEATATRTIEVRLREPDDARSAGPPSTARGPGVVAR